MWEMKSAQFTKQKGKKFVAFVQFRLPNIFRNDNEIALKYFEKYDYLKKIKEKIKI